MVVGGFIGAIAYILFGRTIEKNSSELKELEERVSALERLSGMD